MNCSNLEDRVGSPVACGHEHALEAYANAVRLYQNVVLELQNAGSLDASSLGSVLERAEAAKAVVNCYRGAHRQLSHIPGMPL